MIQTRNYLAAKTFFLLLISFFNPLSISVNQSYRQICADERGSRNCPEMPKAWKLKNRFAVPNPEARDATGQQVFVDKSE
jgi:hypothetical protein